ncbi:hypothetical protein EYR38_002199 [Pleurotus pulmonarius]|nr:hypothetical protein EYR38_002199 [Pleurotus pulmonarius]
MSWPGNVQRPSGPPGASRRNRPSRIASLTHRDALSRPPTVRRTSVSGLTSGAPKTQRTSKTSQKLVVLPSAPQTRPLPTADDEDLKLGYETDAGIREYKSQAERMNKDQRERAGFKRITAYCVAESFRMKLLASFVKREHNVSPRIFDEAVYCMYHLPLLPGYGPGSNFRSSIPVPSTSGKSLLTRLSEAEENGYQGTYFNADIGKAPTTDGYISSSPVLNRRAPDTPEHEIPASASELEPMTASSETEAETDAETERAWTPPRPTPSPMRPPEEDVAEVVFFEYGVAVFFGLTEEQEKGLLEDIEGAGIVRRKIAEEDWEVEACHFTHDPLVTYPRIYNDFFTLKSRSHLLKLSIAHALAQSTLLAHYESEARRVLMSPKAMAIPKQLATSGALQLRRHEALKLTGSLFKLRRDVNLVSNVLDVPELFWSEASLKELYDAVRDYMEIKPRVQVLNEKLGVASDFLDAIHDHLNNSAMERITWIIIWLIVGEVIARLVVHATLNPTLPIRTLSRDEALRTLERMMVQS